MLRAAQKLSKIERRKWLQRISALHCSGRKASNSKVRKTALIRLTDQGHRLSGRSAQVRPWKWKRVVKIRSHRPLRYYQNERSRLSSSTFSPLSSSPFPYRLLSPFSFHFWDERQYHVISTPVPTHRHPVILRGKTFFPFPTFLVSSVATWDKASQLHRKRDYFERYFIGQTLLKCFL